MSGITAFRVAEAISTFQIVDHFSVKRGELKKMSALTFVGHIYGFAGHFLGHRHMPIVPIG